MNPIKEHKLSPAMVEGIGHIGRAYIQVRTVTICALIDRGILTPATGDHGPLLTELGIAVFVALHGSQPKDCTTIHSTTTETDKIPGVTEYAEAMAEAVKPEITITPEPITYDDLCEPDVIAGRCTDCGDTVPDHSWNCTHSAAFRHTAKIVDRDESAEFTARHPKPAPLPSPTGTGACRECRRTGGHKPNCVAGRTRNSYTARDRQVRQYERVRLAKTIAVHMCEHYVPEAPVDAGNRAVLDLARTGAISSDLLYGITGVMLDAANPDLPRDYRFDDEVAREELGWYGWLYGYILQKGMVGDDGWQDRTRSARHNWASVEPYSLDPAEETDLPVWADRNHEQNTVCQAWYYAGGEREYCGAQVSREGFYRGTSGEELCDDHIGSEVRAEYDL